MIEHLFIKNYKAFKKENIPLDKNTLLIGTNASGKTTVLEALDFFFNNVFNYQYIQNPKEDVVIEIHVNDERYRKVFSPPYFDINYEKCIGSMYEINALRFLYVRSHIDPAKLLNDILSINLAKNSDSKEHQSIFKVFDYIDGVVGNSNYELFRVQTRVEMNINEPLQFSREQYTNLIGGITYSKLILGIDNFEMNFDTSSLKKITEYTYQTILTTNSKHVIKHYDYFVHALYKQNVLDEIETIKSRVTETSKTYLLVEGKYDVAWFETALKLLHKYDQYRVIPCGGFGNIQSIQIQLEKEGFDTIVITDGDVKNKTSLRRDIIELYADVNYINKRFSTSFTRTPKTKRELFKATKVKDDVVKKVLSSWARNKLTSDSDFVKEVDEILEGHR